MELQNLPEERFATISNLLQSRDARESYIRATLDVLIPAQIRALRLRERWTQTELAEEAGMKQARISAIETPGSVNFSLETLVRLAAALQVGLQVRFLPHFAMLDWENHFNQDVFDVVRLPHDVAFMNGTEFGHSRQYQYDPNKNLQPVESGRQEQPLPITTSGIGLKPADAPDPEPEPVLMWRQYA